MIDFTSQRLNEDGQMLNARNPGGAPANVAVASGRLGAHTAFMGKAGEDMHGEFFRSVLQKENVDTRGMLLDKNYFTTLAFVEVNESGERTFSFRESREQIHRSRRKNWTWISLTRPIFFTLALCRLQISLQEIPLFMQ